MAATHSLPRIFFKRWGKTGLAYHRAFLELAAAGAKVRAILIRNGARVAQSARRRLIHQREGKDIEMVELGLVHWDTLGLLVRKHVQRHAIQQHI